MGQFVLDLQTFTVIKKHDIDRDNPYLWLVGLRLDRDALLAAVALHAGTRQNLDGLNIVITRDPCVGNLGEKFNKGESRTVSDSLGRFSVPITPPAGQSALFLLMATAMEHSTTTRANQKRAYDAMVDELTTFLVERLRNLNLTEPTPQELAAVETAARERVVQIFRPNPLSDNLIATVKCEFELGASSFSRTTNLRFVSERGGTEYSLSGTVSYAV